MNKLKTTLATIVSTLAITSAIAQTQTRDSILALKDFDGDTKVEFLKMNTKEHPYISLYLQDEGNVLKDNPKKTLMKLLDDGIRPYRFIFGDIDNDGDIDILFIKDQSKYQNLHITFLNDGKANYSTNDNGKIFVDKVK